MSRVKLTKTVLDKASYEKPNRSLHVLWDSEVPGLGLRIYPSGRKAFIIFYRNELRQQKFMVLGPYGALTLSNAREVAREKLSQAYKGKDPAEQKKQNSMGVTFEEFSSSYIERYAKKRKKSWKEDQRRINNYLNKAFRNLKVKTINRNQVSQFHSKLGDKSIYEANRSLSLLSRMFNLAIQWGAVPTGWENPCKGIEKFKEMSRDRFITKEELPRLTASIAKEECLYMKAVFLMLLFTGARKSEILKAQWKDLRLNDEKPELVLNDTKAGERQYINLIPAAVRLLQSLPKLKDNPYIFPGAKKGKHLVNVKNAWNRVRSRAQMSDVHIHDIRRTVGSYLVQMGYSLHMVKQVLRHKDIKTTQIYARFSDNEPRAAIEKHGEFINNAILTE